MKKSTLHPDNPYKGQYHFEELIRVSPELEKFTRPNPMGDTTIDFSDNNAVLALNSALLKLYYNIDFWNIPEGYLCPPIPGRADYIHYIATLLGDTDDEVKVLDIGTGANCIYPIIGSTTFGWNFTGTDIDPMSIENARLIIESNDNIKDKVSIILQENKSNIFKGIIKENEFYDLTMCNPPFHASLKEAEAQNSRKVKNLNIADRKNFGGQKGELWCPGGEIFFLKKMIKESKEFSSQVNWFTALISKSENIRPLRGLARKSGANKVKIIEMSQGHKSSRLIAWTFS